MSCHKGIWCPCYPWPFSPLLHYIDSITSDCLSSPSFRRYQVLIFTVKWLSHFQSDSNHQLLPWETKHKPFQYSRVHITNKKTAALQAPHELALFQLSEMFLSCWTKVYARALCSDIYTPPVHFLFSHIFNYKLLYGQYVNNFVFSLSLSLCVCHVHKHACEHVWERQRDDNNKQQKTKTARTRSKNWWQQHSQEKTKF